MIAIVDYGLGNVKAFATVYKKLNIPASIVKLAGDLEKATKIILPGVGAFDYAMQRLENSGMRTVLDRMVLHRHVPVLGVCVGMQMLAGASEEGKLSGLGWIKGRVKRFDFSNSVPSISIPHMGWNDVKQLQVNGLFQGLGPEARFYFLHSYYFHADKPEDIVAVTDYGGEFICTVNSGNVFGVQFHPEKSHQWGIRLLENFAKI